jgi:hypothetical protein
VNAASWRYAEVKDKLTGEVSMQTALLMSNLTWSSQTFIRVVNSNDGFSVWFEYSGGLIDCSNMRNDCKIRIVFDGEKPVTYLGGVSRDSKTWLIAGAEAKELIASISKAKNIKIEYPVFRRGMDVQEYSPDAPLNPSLKAE